MSWIFGALFFLVLLTIHTETTSNPKGETSTVSRQLSAISAAALKATVYSALVVNQSANNSPGPPSELDTILWDNNAWRSVCLLDPLRLVSPRGLALCWNSPTMHCVL